VAAAAAATAAVEEFFHLFHVNLKVTAHGSCRVEAGKTYRYTAARLLGMAVGVVDSDSDSLESKHCMHEMSIIIKYEAKILSLGHRPQPHTEKKRSRERQRERQRERDREREREKDGDLCIGMSLFNSCVSIFHSNIEFSTHI